MKNFKLAFAAVLGLVFLFTACQKDEIAEPIESNVELTSSEDIILIQNIVEEIDYLEEETSLSTATTEEITPRSVENDCATITVAPEDRSFPRTITINFGEGCEGPRGHVLQGIIDITISDSLYLPGSTRTLSFDNFFVDGAQIEGTRTLINLGKDAEGNLSRSRDVALTITFPDNTQAKWTASHTLVQIEGGMTPRLLADDVFQLTGSSSGTNRKGGSYNASIIDPLMKNRKCPWIQSGMRTITINGTTCTIDYGSGLCDLFATVTLESGESKRILIQPWWK